MKKLLTVGTLLIALTFSVSTNLHAQDEEGTIILEGGLGYGLEIESLGIQGGGIYTINDQFRGALDLIFYFPNDSFGYDFSWFEVNANGHYLFVTEDDLIAYGLAGINVTRWKIDYNGDFGGLGIGSYSKSYVGLNIGAGVEYNLGSIRLYAEAKYALSSADQLALTGGIRLPI